MRLRPVLAITVRAWTTLEQFSSLLSGYRRWFVRHRRFASRLFMPRGGSPNIPWLWALRGRLGVVGYLRLRFARFGSHATERGSEQRAIIAAPNCRIGVTLLRLVDDDRALPAHAERAPIVQCFERLDS